MTMSCVPDMTACAANCSACCEEPHCLSTVTAGTHAVSSSMWVRKIGLPSGTCVELTGVVTNVSAAGGVPFNGNATFQ